MTNHRPGKSNSRDPRPGRYGKQEKQSTNRFIRYWKSSRVRRYLGREQ